MAGHFQVMLAGRWTDYERQEDIILKRAYLAGFPNAKYRFRMHNYHVDFKRMTQTNVTSGKVRQIRPPHKWRAPEKPVVAQGPSFCIKVPPGSPGTCIQVPHPTKKGDFIAVNVPATAKEGASLLIPIPKEIRHAPVLLGRESDMPEASAPAQAATADVPHSEEAALPAPAPTPAAKKQGWSRGSKVAAGGAAVLGVAGLAVAGVVLGEHLAGEGFDGAADHLGDAAADHIGDAVDSAAGVAADGGEWLSGAAGDTGDFVMELF